MVRSPGRVEERTVIEEPDHPRMMLPLFLVACAVGAWLLVLCSLILPP